MEELYTSQNRLELLKERCQRCVCKYCGKSLSLKRLIFSDFPDARIEIYCDHCERIEYGVEPEIYESAKNFVDNLEFNYYIDMDKNEKTHQMNIAKVAEILAWGCRNMGMLNVDGFSVPVNFKEHLMDQCLVISDEALCAEEADDNV